ncbi:hypothetical protein CEUSTIGMA_g226.t1 [Chlamydomonas eustigma]|uniref:Uncharacterized protein n=1 Tax=Chlamydomonas eustigma TaxID=1157962 RepID=A0A250WQE5_9CHLO|nr:hypothetical protein CEUSTIGMA_g226.t1 [Chlamydomonas eustigma]|eukprot:GAX72770.1 hypothetical protein CEUSTIGMA_g226.t1 [Chlamydomonas eustigma]
MNGFEDQIARCTAEFPMTMFTTAFLYLFKTAVDFSGQVLDLEVGSALDMTRPSAPRAADMSKTLSRIVHDPDSELTAWLDYEPKMIQVKPAPSAVPNMTHALDRNRAALLDPRVGQSATGDLDAGVYSARYSLMLPTAPSVDFKSATERSLGYAGDEEQGNVLMLHPEHPKGWQQKTEDDPDRQPFGRKHVRWADASVGNEDEGNMLHLRNSQNDLARLQNRVTLPSAPAAAFGDMTSCRDDVVLQPDPAIPPRPRILQRWVSKIETSLQHHPPSDLAMEILLHEPDDPRVKELKRRHRVWQRLAKKLEQIQMEGAAAELIQHPPAWPEQQSSPGNVHPGYEPDRHPSKAAEYAVAQKAQAYRVQQQRILEQCKQRAEGLKDAGAVHVRPFPWQPEVEQPLPLSAVEVTRAPLGVRPRDEHLMKKIQKEQVLAAEAVRETHWLSRRPWGSENQGETLADLSEGLKHAVGGDTTGRVLKPLEIPLAQLRASKFTAGANAGRTEGMQKKGWGRLRHKLVNEKLRPQWGVTYES